MFRADLCEVNANFLDNLIQASEQKTMVVSEDIYDARGIKLVTTGSPLISAIREQLQFKTLKKPLETSIKAERFDIADILRSEVSSLLAEHHALSRMFVDIDKEGLEIAATPIDHLPRLLLSIAYLNHEKTFKHAVLVTLLSRAIAKRMGYEASFFEPLTQAALAHDLGEMYLAPSYLYTKVRLTAKEWKTSMQHADLGSRLINQYTNYGADVARAVHEHHERENGSGYPQKLKGGQISPMGKILIVAEVLAVLLMRPSNPMRRAQFVLKLNPDEYDKKVLAAVQQLTTEVYHDAEDAHSCISIDSLERLFSELITVIALLKKYMSTPVSLGERKLLEDALQGISSMRMALSSLGLDYCVQLKNYESLEDPQARMEVEVAAHEVVWRLRAKARDLLLSFADEGVNMSHELQTIIAIMSQTSLR